MASLFLFDCLQAFFQKHMKRAGYKLKSVTFDAAGGIKKMLFKFSGLFRAAGPRIHKENKLSFFRDFPQVVGPWVN